jgi:hypothetical protein
LCGVRWNCGARKLLGQALAELTAMGLPKTQLELGLYR